MALSGSGIRDTARVLGISTDTVLNELKKRVVAQQCEPLFAHLVEPG
jgi:transposase-like protein